MQELIRLLEDFVEVSWLVVAGLILLGFASSASLEIAKELLPLRWTYQWRILNDWVQARWRGVDLFEKEIKLLQNTESDNYKWCKGIAKQLVPPDQVNGVSPTSNIDAQATQLIERLVAEYTDIKDKGVMAALSGGSRLRSLLRLPSAKFSGQLSNFAKVVQDRPATFAREYLLLSEGSDIRDQAIAIMADQAQRMYPEKSSILAGAPTENSLAAQLVAAQEAIPAQVEANVDKLQLRLMEGWAALQRKLAIAISLIISGFILTMNSYTSGAWPMITAWLILGLLGGYTAVLIHNLVSLLELPKARR